MLPLLKLALHWAPSNSASRRRACEKFLSPVTNLSTVNTRTSDFLLLLRLRPIDHPEGGGSVGGCEGETLRQQKQVTTYQRKLLSHKKIRRENLPGLRSARRVDAKGAGMKASAEAANTAAMKRDLDHMFY